MSVAGQYTAEDLRGFEIKPRINDIDLDVLQDYYEKFLNPFIYEYDIQDEDEHKSIRLRFAEENFCHLVGLESIVKHSVPRKELHNYKGQDGWQFIKNSCLWRC